MNKKRIVKTSFKSITIYLVIIAVLIDSTTMYRFLTNSPLYGHGFGWPLGIVCLLYALQTSKLKNLYILKFRFPLLIALLLIYAGVTGYNVQRYLASYVGVFFALFILAYALYQNNEMKKFLQAFSNVMLVVALVSLFFWLFGSIMNILPGRTALTYRWAERYRETFTYLYLYFENPSQNAAHGVICNLGIFTESPAYSGFLTFAMLIEIVLRNESFSRKQKRKTIARVLVFMITLLTTNSTKGIIAILIALGIEYISRETKNRRNMFLKILGTVVLITIIAFVSNSLIGRKLATNSGVVRLDDLRSGFITFLRNPLFGAGYNNVNAIAAHQLVIRGNQGISMGLTTLLAYGGLWMFGIYCGAVVTSSKTPYFKKNKKSWFLIVTVLVYNLVVSNSGFTDPYIFMVAAAYAAPSTRDFFGRGIRKNATKFKKELSI